RRGNHHRQVGQVHDRLDLAGDEFGDQFDGFDAAIVGGGVRVEVHPEQSVGVIDHLLGDVAVQVQRHHDGHVGADQFTHALDDVAFDVVNTSRNPCAVQCQADRVNFTG